MPIVFRGRFLLQPVNSSRPFYFAINAPWTSTAVDDFDDGTIDTSIWDENYGPVSESGGRAVLTCNTGYTGLQTTPRFQLDTWHVQCFPAAASGATIEANTGGILKTPDQPDGTDVGWAINTVSGQVTFSNRVGYFDGSAVTLTYSATDHRWLRMSVTETDLLWDTSPDGITWTNRRTATAPAWLLESRTLRLLLETHRNDGVANTAEFDNVNITPASTPATVTPTTVSAVAAVASPAVQLSAVPAPSTVSASATVPAPTVRLSATPAPATVAASAAVPASTVQTTSSATATPATVAATAAVPAATVRLSALPVPATVAATAAVPAPTVRLSVNPAPSTVTATAAVPAPTVRLSAAIAPTTVAAAAAVGTPTAGLTRAFTTASTSIQVTGLTASTQYKARIRARDAAGNWSAYSEPITFTTTAVSAATPATVAAVAAVPTPDRGASITPATVTASAAIPTPAAGYERSQTVAGTSASVTGLLPGKTYTARVRARDAAGNWSAYSTAITFNTVNAPAPATVAATAAIPSASIGGAPPTVTAGTARPVVRGAGVLLDLTVVPSGGSTVTSYSWAIQGGAAGSLTNATTATPTYTAPGTGSGLVTVRGTVFTSNGGSAFADVTVSYHANIVAAENALTGTARATWDLASPNLGGVSTLQGFCDGFTVDKTGTASFKIAQSDAAGWSADVYRLGYYGGNGARLYGTVTPSGGQLTASQAQPAPADADPNTSLLSADCGGWSTTLTWTPPAWAPSGIYILRLNRTGGGASHVMFIVRDDARDAALMVMPSDSTWNAYNAWGGMGASMYSGNSLYLGTSVAQYDADCARFVSYDRPVVNRGAADSGRSYGAVEWSTFFTGEYPMVRFLERNGVDAKYYGCIDAAGDASGTHLIGNGSTRGGTGAAMMIGHNEYWSNHMRSGWEAAKNAGVNIFSCAANEVFWRLVGSDNDADGRPRLWECFKSTIASRASTGRTEWTGTWRDPDGAGKGGNNPENNLTGTIFVVNGPDLRSIVVPFAGGYSATPLWRHTSVAALASGSYTSPSQILGFEWDTYGPAGVNTTGASYLAAPHPRAIYCSDVTYSVTGFVLTDAGDEYGNGNVTHRLVVHPGGAGGIVFGTGTINWAFGVDNANTYQTGSDNVDTVIQQATLNVLTDMGAAPVTLMSGLTQPTPVDWYIDALPATVAAVAAIPQPTVTTATVPAPATVAAVASVPTPTVANSPAPATVTATAAIPAPGVRLSVLPAPATVAATAATPAPTVRAGATATPATVTAGAAVPASAVTLPGTVTPATVTATAAVPAPAVRLSVLPVATTVAAVAAIPASTRTSSVATTPTTVTANAAIPAPGIQAGSSSTAAATTVTATAAVPAPTVTGASSATATPATVSAVTSVSGAASLPRTVTPAAVTATAAVGVPSLRVGAAPAPAAIVVTVTVPAPTMRTGSLLAPATVIAVTAIAAPTVSSLAIPQPVTVSATTTIAVPALRTSSVATPATIALAAFIGTISHIVGAMEASTAVASVTGGSLTARVTGDTPTMKVT